MQDPNSRSLLLYKHSCIDEYAFSYNYEARHNKQKPDNNGQQPCWIQSWREELQDANEKKKHETQHPTKSTGGSQVVDIQPQTPSKSVPMALCVSPVFSCRTISLSIYQSVHICLAITVSETNITTENRPS